MHTFVTPRIDCPDPSHGTRRRPQDYTSCEANKKRRMDRKRIHDAPPRWQPRRSDYMPFDFETA